VRISLKVREKLPTSPEEEKQKELKKWWGERTKTKKEKTV